MNVCVIIPAHNEAPRIGNLLDSLKPKQMDVVVIDDGSTDHSGSIAKEKGAVVIKNDSRQGKGASLQKGFDYALRRHYDGVMAMDGDGQHDVKDLDAFLDEAKKHPDAIISGNRMHEPKGMPLVRFLTNRLMSVFISKLCKQNIPDTQCGYRYISCRILRDIDLACDDFEIETEVLIKASQKGYKIFSVPITTIYSGEASKINPLKDTIRFFAYLIKEFLRP